MATKAISLSSIIKNNRLGRPQFPQTTLAVIGRVGSRQVLPFPEIRSSVHRDKLIRQNSRLPHDDTLFSRFFARIVSISFRLMNIFLFGEADDARAGERRKEKLRKAS